jgi:hypothetical protein
MPFKSVFVTPVTTCAEVVALVLRKYQFPGDPAPWSLYRLREHAGPPTGVPARPPWPHPVPNCACVSAWVGG